jgi:hypothetical protein
MRWPCSCCSARGKRTTHRRIRANSGRDRNPPAATTAVTSFRKKIAASLFGPDGLERPRVDAHT